MPEPKIRHTKRIPSYRLHRPSGQAVVTLRIGPRQYRDHYLGPHGSPESREKYGRLIAEWLGNGRQRPIQARRDLTVTELCAAYWRHAEQHYRRPDGSPTSGLENHPPGPTPAPPALRQHARG